MKAVDAIRILQLMDSNTEVELIFPDAVKEVYTPRKPQLTEGAMASLPMYRNSELDDWASQHLNYHAEYHGG